MMRPDGPDPAKPGAASGAAPASKSDALTDLALTMPIFLLYHLGVAFLPIRNAADPVTAELHALAKHSLPLYAGLTVAVGAAFVLVLSILGRGHALRTGRFALLAAEGALYAILMRFAGAYVVGSLRLGPPASSNGVFAGVIMSLGAGFYEEIAFRAVLFGLGALGIKFLFGKGVRGVLLTIAWHQAINRRRSMTRRDGRPVGPAVVRVSHGLRARAHGDLRVSRLRAGRLDARAVRRMGPRAEVIARGARRVFPSIPRLTWGLSCPSPRSPPSSQPSLPLS